MDAPSDRARARGRTGQNGRLCGPVLVGYDVTASDRRPVEFGIAAARCTGASRIIVCVYATPAACDRLGSTKVDEDLVAEAARAVDEVEHELPTESLTIKCRAVDGTNVARGLHGAARSARARLLVVGSARPRAARGLPGSLVERIMHGVSCPIAVVPYGWESAVECTVIGVAYTDRMEGRDALRGAHALAYCAHASVRVVTAVGAASADSIAAVGAVQRAMAALEGDVPVEMTTVEGDPADVLVCASRSLDVLVIGSRGYGRLGVVSLGDVNRRVALEAHCPVIVVPRGDESRLQAVPLDASSAATGD
jgi:nucleotide-binding universal stress UspA family protein